MKFKLRLAAAFTIAALGAPILSVATQHEVPVIDASIAEHMRMHFSAARAIRAFVIAGQIDGVPESAEWLITHDTAAGLPGDWAPYIAEMRGYAEEAASARHLVFAAAALSEMARTCGDCHAANGLSVVVADDIGVPPDGDGVRVQMRRHLWAADRMWEGLIGPSDAAWILGTEALAGSRLEVSDFDIAADQEPALGYLLGRIREIGEQGSQAESRESRSALYGEFLATCGDCHTLIGRGPQPPRTVQPAGDGD